LQLILGKLQPVQTAFHLPQALLHLGEQRLQLLLLRLCPGVGLCQIAAACRLALGSPSLIESLQKLLALCLQLRLLL